MTFGDNYRPRFDDVIAPAIRAVKVNDVQLEPRRVDESKSGDCILTEIVDGIAHSQIVLADVSTLGRDSKSGRPYRNGNVMYEVGVALACRQPTEVLLIRDDRDPFLFDVSTIPHMTLDFADVGSARSKLSNALSARIRERDLVDDARFRMAISDLSTPEAAILRDTAGFGNGVFYWHESGLGASMREWAVTRLLDKQLVRAVGQTGEGAIKYRLTALGEVAMRVVGAGEQEFPSET